MQTQRLKPVTCRRCHASNEKTSVYCAGCGALLSKKPAPVKPTIPWRTLLIGMAGLLLGILLFFTLTPQKSQKWEPEERAAEKPEPDPAVLKGGVPSFVAGQVVVRDVMGAVVTRTEVAVANGKWAAVPIWALFGGDNSVFQYGDSSLTPVEKGFWTTGDPLILCLIEGEKKWEPPNLHPYNPDFFLRWQPLSASGPPIAAETLSLRRRGSFLSLDLPEEARAPGVFLQENRIVGWTFGDQMEKGYLWAGPAGSDLHADIRLDQLFRQVFLNCREAQFRRALAMGKGTPSVERLRALTQAFRLAPLLGIEDTPLTLSPQFIAGQLHSLAAELISSGSAREVVLILDDNILREASDPVIVQDAVLAVAKSQDINRALQYLERMQRDVFAKSGRSLSGLDPFRLQLYKDWLQEIIAKGGYYSGTMAFEEARRAFPDDAELRLLGAEIILAGNDWKKAKELMRGSLYPPSLKERADKLNALIKEMEETETATVKFHPGEAMIHLEAVLNGSVPQNFILDTGASITAIPSSAVKALRIRVDDTTPVKVVATAGGLEFAHEITLNSIELRQNKDHRVDNIKALVIDLPGYAGTGILGLNFLNHFSYEIDKQGGVLRLRKR